MISTSFSHSLLPSAPRKGNKRFGLSLLAGFVCVASSLAWATHALPHFGPWAANRLRALVGTDNVSRLEDLAYGARDQVLQVTRAGEAAQSHWEVPAAALEPAIQPSSPFLDAEAALLPTQSHFAPASAPLPFPEVAAHGDGIWVSLDGDQSPMRKTLIHPDPKRTWSELFVVAIDLSQVELHWLPGSSEPESLAPGATRLKRSARIPESAYPALLAAFNGGFKSVHGKFGAAAEGTTLVQPRPHSCTFAQSEAGELILGTHHKLDLPSKLHWLRQTPGCMVEDGKLHPGLAREETKNWGATLEGDTVIRRSALGLSSDGKVLFVGISNDTTARAIALGMKAAGATTVAQLDVNYSYPKFILFNPSANAPSPVNLVEGFVMKERQYLEKEQRDFFFLTKRNEEVADLSDN